MPENEKELDLEFGDYELDDDHQDATPVEPEEALDYHDSPGDDLSEGLGGPGDAPNTPKEAIAEARALCEHRTYVGVGYCLRAVRGYYGVLPKYLSAEDAWFAAAHKVRVSSGSQIPRGVPVYWTNGKYGHIAISIGGGLCYSTDWKVPGKVDIARIDDITKRWNQKLQGYAWEVNDVVVWTPNVPKVEVKISNLRPGERNDDVVELKKALRAKGFGGFGDGRKFGKNLQDAYKKYQKRLGYTGAAADGIPGWQSLRKLGFRITK